MAGQQLQGAGTGAASGAAMGTAIMPGWGTAIGAVAGGVLGYLGQSQDQGNLKSIARKNLIAQQQNQQQQRAFAQQLLNMSHPAMTSQQIGDLLFKQGAEARQLETDRQLQTILRANLRAGSPSSSGELIARANAANAGTVGDLRTNATLQGLQAALPSSTAINAAAALYGGGAPQYSYNPQEGLAQAQFAGATANTLGGLIDQYLRYKQAQGGTPTSTAGDSSVAQGSGGYVSGFGQY